MSIFANKTQSKTPETINEEGVKKKGNRWGRILFWIIFIIVCAITAVKLEILSLSINNDFQRDIYVYNSLFANYNNGHTPTDPITSKVEGIPYKPASDYQKAATEDDATAQHCLYHCYMNGIGVDIDENKAIQWLIRSAENGHPSALVDLGAIYLYGDIVVRNEKRAFECFQRAAEEKDAKGYYNLGVCFNNGFGCDKDSERALKNFKKAAELGDVHARYVLGCIHADKDSSIYSPTLAFECFNLGASKQHPGAEFELGKCYSEGIGVEIDKQAAFHWIRRAARHDYSHAQGHTALCYLFGEGVEKDFNMAFQWARRSAAFGSPVGMFALGLCYEKGYGVEVDLEEAKKHYELAATNGHAGAQVQLSTFYNELDIENESISALFWLTKAAEGGAQDAEAITTAMLLRPLPKWQAEQLVNKLTTLSKENNNAQYFLGVCCENGWGTEQNGKKAFDYYLEAANNGHFAAMLQLALMYGEGRSYCKKNVEVARAWLKKINENDANPSILANLGTIYQAGKIVPKDEEKGFKLVRKAAQKGSIAALSSLGFFYLNGTGCKPDEKEAFQCFTEASGHGIASGYVGLGLCYLGGKGTKIDYSKAKESFEKAAQMGEANGYLHLGLMYVHGQGVKPDIKKAIQHFQDAANLGSSEAYYNIGYAYLVDESQRNERLAIEYFQKAEERGSLEAEVELAIIYINRYLKEKNKKDAEMAAFWCRKGLEHDKPIAGALYVAGICYKEGIGMKKDAKIAKEYLNAAAKMNHKDAKKLLDDMESFF